MSLNGQLTNISSSGGLISNEFLISIKNPDSSHSLVKIESFFKPGDQIPSSKEFAENLNKTFKDLLERWDDISLRYSSFDVSDARNKWILPVLRALGFDPLYNKEDICVGKDARLKFRLSHRGWCAQSAPYIHTVPPSQDLDTRSEKEKRSPHDAMQTYLNVQKDCLWGVVTNGIILRVLREFYHTYTKGYVEFDLENIFRERSFKDFLALYRVVHASRFIPDQEGICPLEHFYKESVAAGVKIGESLRDNVKTAIEMLGNGFLNQELIEKLSFDEEFCKEYYSDLLVIVYRTIFLLFAEQRGMLPSRDSLYAEEYSITKLRDKAEKRLSRDAHKDLWDGLKVTFQMIKHGCSDLKVFGYNGSLFDDSELKILGNLQCKNEELLKAIRCLTIFEKERVLQRINYLDLGVEEVGAIYESLLDFSPRVSLNKIELDSVEISARTFFLDPRGAARRTTGSYYTNPRLVNELIQSALKPVIEHKLIQSTDKERILLSIKVCDPACGSAAFLIAATNFLGRELAKVRTGNDYPSEIDERKARRDVLQHCIYGVDLNPMAVELAKVSLWINACVRDLPLNFLDHHIKCGNSLIGVTPKLLEKGIPNEAFQPTLDDKKDFAKEIVTINKKQKLMKMIEEVRKEDTELYYKSAFEKISNIDESKIEDVEKKKEAYYQLINSAGWHHKILIADTWTSAFFWSLKSDSPSPPTEGIFRIILKNSNTNNVDKKILEKIKDLAKRYKFFHWYLEFPDVFSGNNPGFDCMLGNPPWEKIKIMEREWFDGRNQEIADCESKSKRSEFINELKEKDPLLHSQFEDTLNRSELTTKFITASGRFPLSSKGDINTYPLFTELSLSDLMNREGKTGMVVKTGIATDFYTKTLFSFIVENNLLVSLYDFVNSEKIFPSVAPPERFCLLTLTGADAPSKEFEFSFYNTNFDMLADQTRRYFLTKDDILKINPNTKNCPAFNNRQDKEITLKIYNKFPILINEITGENPWGIKYATMYHMTNDTEFFIKNTKEYLEEQGFSLGKDGIFRKNDVCYLPLWEAKFFHHFDHRFGSFEDIPIENRFIRKAGSKRITSEQKQDVNYEITPRYWVKDTDFEKKKKEINWDKEWFFTFRDITNTTTNFRTAIGTISPYYPSSNASPFLTFNDNKEKMAVLFCTLFTSFVFDFITRQKVGGAHLNLFTLSQLPMPTLDQINNYKIYIDDKEENLKDFLINQAIKLLWTSHSLDSLGSIISYGQGPYIWNDDERRKMRSLIDASLMKISGLTYEEYEYILDSFHILRDKDIEEFDEYRTKKECLSIYNRITIKQR